MLSLLHIENIAVIECADIEFGPGLTVLTGETGAGKSIILDAIGALLGQRTSRELIRSGADQGFVSAVFTSLSPALSEILMQMDLQGEEADTLYVQRRLTADGKTTCRVNMKPASVTALKTLAPYLMNIHGQHDGQKLLNETCHIEYLDSFCGAEKLLAQYQPIYQSLLTLKRRIAELDKNEQERLQRIDMLRYHVEEIDDAALQPGEEERLLEQKICFDNAEKLFEALQFAQQALNGDDDMPGAIDRITSAADRLHTVEHLLEPIRSDAERADELKCLVADLRDSISQTLHTLDFSEQDRVAVEERLDLIYRLRQKYGESVGKILEYAEKSHAELDELENADENRGNLRAEYHEKIATAKEFAGKLTKLRLEGGKLLENAIIQELNDLDMLKVRLEIRVETGNKLTANGMDTVTFLISVNPGEAVKPLSKVASGGELSRIMLSMKNVLTSKEPVETLIFDEIDTGVSGRAAQKIAHKLHEIGQKKQTLCVTHLPQIAATGAQHLYIEKNIAGARSYTQVRPLDEYARVQEIARMLAGDTVTDAAINNARELLDGARR